MYGNQLLSCIDNIENVSVASELEVLQGLTMAYIKEYTMLSMLDSSDVVMESESEYHTHNYTDDYNILGLLSQTKAYRDLNATLSGHTDESKLKKILMFLPRLIVKIFRILLKAIAMIITGIPMVIGIVVEAFNKSEHERFSSSIDFEAFHDFVQNIYAPICELTEAINENVEDFNAGGIDHAKNMLDRNVKGPAETFEKVLTNEYAKDKPGYNKIFRNKTYIDSKGTTTSIKNTEYNLKEMKKIVYKLGKSMDDLLKYDAEVGGDIAKVALSIQRGVEVVQMISVKFTEEVAKMKKRYGDKVNDPDAYRPYDPDDDMEND
jgi:hypothetical protein